MSELSSDINDEIANNIHRCISTVNNNKIFIYGMYTTNRDMPI